MQHRNRLGTLGLAALTLFLCALRPSVAAITPTGDTTIAATSSQDSTIGNSGIGTLTIDVGSSLSNAKGYIGNLVGSNGTVVVDGAGSTWTNGSGLYVGNSGNGTLSISSGAQVSDSFSYLATNAGSTGTVSVTGTGSAWTHSLSFTLGYLGAGTLTVEAGGAISCTTAYLGSDAGSEGTAIIRGNGSSLTCTSGLVTGFGGRGSITVESGGVINTATTTIGASAGSIGTGTVSGAGSAWKSTSTFSVGYSGNGTLNIGGGAQVTCNIADIGYNAASTGLASISGIGSRLVNNNALTVGYYGSGSLTIDAGAQVSNGSRGFIGRYAGSFGTVTVRGSGSALTFANELYVGGNDYLRSAGQGTLLVTDGGAVSASTLYATLGDLQGNGTITVSKGAVLDADLVFDATHGTTQAIAFGAGGTLNLSLSGGDLGVGYKSVGTMRIADGMVISSLHGYLGCHSGSSGTVTVTGAGSKWSTTWEISVGRYGSGKLIVTDGGTVNTPSIRASFSDLLGNGTITARGGILDADLIFDATHGTSQTLPFGSGGVLSLSLTGSELGVGFKGTGTLRIADGLSINASGYLGLYAGSSGTATITGTGTVWNASLLTVGGSGQGTLFLESGAKISGQQGIVGGTSGTATVRGTGSAWTLSTQVSVGDASKGTLIIEDSGQVSCPVGRIGHNAGTATLIVRGLNSKFTCTSGVGDLNLGGTGGNGELIVESGATVSSNTAVLGHWTGSIGKATIRGTGSKWTNTREIVIGNLGFGTLIVDDGAEMKSAGGYFGNGPDGHGAAIIRGTGSKWTNTGELRLGQQNMQVNSLTIESGALVTNTTAWLGYTAGATATVKVRGAGSKWISSGNISSMGNKVTLLIESGATVQNVNASLAINSSASATAVVTGTGSTWTNSGALSLGSGQASLTIADGARVTARSLSLAGSSSLRFLVSGNNMLTLGDATTSGSITNTSSTVAFLANAFLPVGVYQPITEFAGRNITWTGSGTYVGIGGVWNNTTKTFTTTAPTTLEAGSVDTLTTAERLLFTESSTGKRACASFGTVTAGKTFSTTPISDAERAALAALIDPDDQVAAGWNFTTNYTGTEVLLSFDIGSIVTLDDLAVWKLQNGQWSPFTPATLSYDSAGQANFTVSSFSAYAITVPEPGALTLLALTTLALLPRQNRRQNRRHTTPSSMPPPP